MSDMVDRARRISMYATLPGRAGGGVVSVEREAIAKALYEEPGKYCDACNGIGQDENIYFWCSPCKGEGWVVDEELAPDAWDFALIQADAVLAALRDVRGTATPEPEWESVATRWRYVHDIGPGLWTYAHDPEDVPSDGGGPSRVESEPVYRRVTPEPERCKTCGGTRDERGTVLEGDGDFEGAGYHEIDCDSPFHGHTLGSSAEPSEPSTEGGK